MSNKDRYLQIFQYLLKFSELRTKTVRDIENDSQYPEKLWFSNIPKCQIFDTVLNEDFNPDNEYWVKVQKPKEPTKPTFPSIPNIIENWIDRETLDDEENGPQLLDTISIDDKTYYLQDYPKVVEKFDEYINNKWLDDIIDYKNQLDHYDKEYKEFKTLNDIYKFFFRVYNKVQQFAEDFELIVGVGLLDFKENDDTPQIRRHVLTQKVDITYEYSQHKSIIKVTPNIESEIQTETDAIDD